MEIDMKFTRTFHFGRFLWTVFVFWYFIIFSRNFFSSINPDRSPIPVAFFMILVLWMAIEYYFSSPLFQSGIVKPAFLERSLFSIYFYATTIYCIADFVSLRWTQINFAYPYLNIIGIIIFTIAVLIRFFTLIELLRLPAQKLPKSGIFQVCRHPRYWATILQTIAIPLVFSSYVVIILAVTIGLYLIFREMRAEEKILLKNFQDDYLFYQKNVTFLKPRLSRLSLVKTELSQKQKPKKPNR